MTYRDVLEKLANNNENIKKRIIVKPGLTREINNRFLINP
jgi:hypothetical protein